MAIDRQGTQQQRPAAPTAKQQQRPSRKCARVNIFARTDLICLFACVFFFFYLKFLMVLHLERNKERKEEEKRKKKEKDF